VLVAREASVMELFAVELDRLAGAVVEHGGPQSHAAILARTLGIPMVGQVGDFGALLRPGRRLLVDGTAGLVGLDPPAGPEEEASRKGAKAPSEAEKKGDQTGPPSVSTSSPLCAFAPLREASSSGSATGIPQAEGLPRVEVNINLLYEVRAALEQGAGGVGLYRSEFLFLARRTLPTEEEQVGTYRKLVQMLQGRPVSIRTFDLRPDKLAAYSYLGSAATRPFDWRLVLDSPPLQQLFYDQVRAILRAATQGPARILVPLVTSSELLDFVVETVARARAALGREGLACAADVPLGVTIEVAAATSLVGAWAEQVAFFSLGTNDLTASALGLDRDVPVAAGLADPLHPGLLRLIDDVVTDAHEAGRPVTVCGEMAADPLGALALAALRVDALSVPVGQLTATRQALAGVAPGALADLRAQLLRQRTAKAIRQLLRQWPWAG
jgi:phosphotransferase system enzyme I (PtsP)